MNVSVIIPVFNAKKYLPILFNALDNNNFDNDDEILLIDNGSTDETAEICKIKVDENPVLYKYFYYADKADSYAARNFGLRKVKNEILVFTDSDCKPKSEWINTIKKEIKSGTVMAGMIHLELINGGLWEVFDTIAHLQSEKESKVNNVPTANMAILKEDFYKVGKFDERFSGGDYVWSQRAASKGMKILYFSEMLVFHPTRKTFEEILKKNQRIAYGFGKNYISKRGSYIILCIIYLLKILKIDANLRYSKELKNKSFKIKDIIKFNCKFERIRYEQFKHAKYGYKGVNPRELGIK